jgi:nanoRNase/pAp phosphatase (c-di-AMP/oligoRNAs hydrolase)
MTAFVESCVTTAADKAELAERLTRDKPRAWKLIGLLEGKQKILITTHIHPDPDAIASSMALLHLLRSKLRDTTIHFSVKGQVGGGLNDAFTRFAKLDLTPWEDENIASYDAIILLDSQPGFAYSPLPAGVSPTAVIDHHPLRYSIGCGGNELDRVQLFHGAGDRDSGGFERVAVVCD